MTTELIERGDSARADDDSTSLTPAPPPSALVTLDPEAYTAAVFNPFVARVKAAKQTVAETPVYDITTKAGLATATKLRALFRKIRTEGDAERKLRTEPVTKIQKRLIEEFAKLKAEVEPFEARFDAEIEAENKRQEQVAEAKRQEEAARVAALQEKVRAIGARTAEAVGKTPDEIAAIRAEVMAIDPTEAEYEELAGAALRVQRETLVELDRLHAAAVEQQRKNEEAERNRLELERLREDKAKAERAAAIRERITGMKSLAEFESPAPASEVIKARIAKAFEIDTSEDSFGDQVEIAQLVLNGVRDKLNVALVAAMDREQAAATKAEAERQRLADERAKQQETERENAKLREQLAAAQRVASEREAAPTAAAPPEPVSAVVEFTATKEYRAFDDAPDVAAADVAEIVAGVADLPASPAIPKRPTDTEIVRAVADAFHVDSAIAKGWIRAINFAAI
ncbi:hypothetical protein [Nevskia sp.]|uniref:hypothetical protein n=1 Tax=Nevskia sp. TaxID=1929292 RepID=UPI0025FB00A8|nr:hypothetical protein [Nevskia sp.]